jgi:hypothetical protein
MAGQGKQQVFTMNEERDTTLWENLNADCKILKFITKQLEFTRHHRNTLTNVSFFKHKPAWKSYSHCSVSLLSIPT